MCNGEPQSIDIALDLYYRKKVWIEAQITGRNLPCYHKIPFCAAEDIYIEKHVQPSPEQEMTEIAVEAILDNLLG